MEIQLGRNKKRPGPDGQGFHVNIRSHDPDHHPNRNWNHSVHIKGTGPGLRFYEQKFIPDQKD